MTDKSKWLRIVGGILVLLGGLFEMMNVFVIAFGYSSSVSQQTAAGSVFSALWLLALAAFVAVSLFIGKPKLIASALSVSLVCSVASGAYSRISMLIATGAQIAVISNVIYAVTTLLFVAASIILIVALLNCERRRVHVVLWIIPIVLFTLLGLWDLLGGTYGSAASLIYNLLFVKGNMSMHAILNTTRVISFVLFVPTLYKSVCAAVWGLVNYGTRYKM